MSTSLVTPTGKLCGIIRDGVRIFRGIRYGERATPDRRYSELCNPQEAGEAPVSVFPQLPNRLTQVMGDVLVDVSQSEDAFLLNLWAPVGAENAPVLVFLHGGGWSSGGGTALRYDGERIARESGLIVATVNYRLGALGHLLRTDESDGNLPFRDIIRALEWLQVNVRAFGGDPANVTVSGQSAGAWYAYLLGVSVRSKGLLRRNIILSTPYLPPQSRESANEVASLFSRLTDGRDPETLPVSAYLEAQTEIVKRNLRFGELAVPGFYPIADGEVVPAWLFDFPRAAKQTHVEATMVGHTKEEMTSFLFASPEERHPEASLVDAWFGEKFGAASQTYRETFIAKRRGSTPYTLLVDGATELTFARPARAIAQSLAETGKAAWLYRFDVESGSDDFMSPHCFELPFLFGNRVAWSDAPMLKTIDEATYEKAGLEFRSAVLAFATVGEPRASDGLRWSAFDPTRPMLNAVTTTVAASPF